MILHTNKYNSLISEALAEHNIKCRETGFDGMLAINRTDCHNSDLCKGLMEWDIINVVLYFIRKTVNEDSVHLAWCSKTDEEWFLEIFNIDKER